MHRADINAFRYQSLTVDDARKTANHDEINIRVNEPIE